MKETMKIFGTRVKKLRKERKMSQGDLAKDLGVHFSYIGLLERGERAPSMFTLTKIAKYFGVRPADLIMEEKAAQKLNLKQKELLYIVKDGSQEQIDKLYKVAKIVIGTKKKRQ